MPQGLLQMRNTPTKLPVSPKSRGSKPLRKLQEAVHNLTIAARGTGYIAARQTDDERSRDFAQGKAREIVS